MRAIYDALNDERFQARLQLHMPGHLGGRGFDEFKITPEMDVTELAETDDLHNPETVIKASQDWAAKVFGAKKAYYMVNGSTGGVLAMALGFLKDGDLVIADRFCHKSFVSALALTGAEAVWIEPEIIKNGAMWGSVTAEDVEKAARCNPEAKAVFITAPNYFGMMGDVKAIAEVTHKYGMKLLVDGAHGAHFGMSEHLPPKIISLGADAVCVSLHKTLPALTQSAMLLTSERYERVEAALKTVQSSSPSYLLTSSCENAVNYYEKGNEEAWERLYKNVEKYFPESLTESAKSVRYKDFSRVNAEVNVGAFEAGERLRKEFNIAVECVYPKGVVAILTPFHEEKEIRRFYEAVKVIKSEKISSECVSFAPPKGKKVFSPREAFFAKKRRVLLREAEGKISASGIAVYPPGIYQVLPGEEITKEAVERITELEKKGAEIHGVEQSCCLIFDV